MGPRSAKFHQSQKYIYSKLEQRKEGSINLIPDGFYANDDLQDLLLKDLKMKRLQVINPLKINL